MAIKAPFLPYDSLRTQADDFLSRYYPSGTIPVPIGNIVEFQFGIDIVPIPGLQESFDTDSAISKDLNTIYIDDFVFNNRKRRYHFSLAHELSHKLIHAEIFGKLSFLGIARLEGSDAFHSAGSIHLDRNAGLFACRFDIGSQPITPNCLQQCQDHRSRCWRNPGRGRRWCPQNSSRQDWALF